MISGMPSDTPRDASDSADERAIPFLAGRDADAPPVNLPQAAEEEAPESPSYPFEVVREPRLDPVAPRALSEFAPPPAAAPRPSSWGRLCGWLIPLLLFFCGAGAVLLTQRGIGISWDEAYYYEPSLKAADWLAKAVHGEKPFSRDAIDAAWAGPGGEFGHGYQEHPSVMKFLCGLALRALPGAGRQLGAMRLPGALLFGLTLSLLFMLGRRAWGAAPGLLAALIYAAMPRVFGHAHFASLETPLLFMMMLTVYCFLRGLDSPVWAALTGVAFGLLLATKINGFFLPIPLVLWAQFYVRRRYVNNLFAMLTLGPVVFVLAWPWLWPDPVMRLLQYLAFHARHQLTAVFFLGKLWGYDAPNAPWYYPLTMTAVTLPLTALLLAALGIGRAVAAPRRRPAEALCLICALVMLLVASAPSTPKYDGERLFLTVFPFLALLGGTGAAGVIEMVERRLANRGEVERVKKYVCRWLAGGLGLLVLLEGGVSIFRYHPYLLSYYNPLVGGLPGASSRAGALFETAYWGEALNDKVIAALNALPPGSSVKPLALHAKCLELLQTWGILDRDLLIDKPKRTNVGGVELEYFDYHLLQFRQGFFRGPERALAGSNRFLVQTWGWGAGEDLIPMIGLYRTGPAFELFWRGMGR